LDVEKQKSILKKEVSQIESDPIKVDRVVESIQKATILKVDTSKLFGNRSVTNIDYSALKNVQDLVNLLWYTFPRGKIRPRSCGVDWVLRNEKGEFLDIGGTWARKRGLKGDRRSLEEVDIHAGDKLFAMKP